MQQSELCYKQTGSQNNSSDRVSQIRKTTKKFVNTKNINPAQKTAISIQGRNANVEQGLSGKLYA